jgi:hypothetical protein
MRIELKTYDLTITVEHLNDDLTIDDYLDVFKGLLIQVGFSTQTFNNAILEMANELKEDANTGPY